MGTLKRASRTLDRIMEQEKIPAPNPQPAPKPAPNGGQR